MNLIVHKNILADLGVVTHIRGRLKQRRLIPQFDDLGVRVGLGIEVDPFPVLLAAVQTAFRFSGMVVFEKLGWGWSSLGKAGRSVEQDFSGVDGFLLKLQNAVFQSV